MGERNKEWMENLETSCGEEFRGIKYFTEFKRRNFSEAEERCKKMIAENIFNGRLGYVHKAIHKVTQGTGVHRICRLSSNRCKVC